MLTLRPYQESTADFVFRYAAENIRGRLVVVIPPGGGKTPIAAHVLRVMAAEQGLRGLAWAHRRELVGQMHDHLVECGVPAEMIGVGMAGDKRHNPTAPIQVWSVDTLRHRDKPLADIVVSDEAHRDASDGRRKLRALYPDAFHLGFTGTPIRLDGRGLKDDYDEMYVGARPSELIAEKHIVAPANGNTSTCSTGATSSPPDTHPRPGRPVRAGALLPGDRHENVEADGHHEVQRRPRDRLRRRETRQGARATQER